MKLLLRYFIRGLVFLIPIIVTVYILVFLVGVINSAIPALFGESVPVIVGFLIVIVLITIMGMITSIFIVKPFFSLIENYIYKIPFINIIYSSTKDIVGSFVGDKKKFEHPVLVYLDDNKEIGRIGFVTREFASNSEVGEMTSVYFPHSYNISGNIILVHKNRIKHLSITGREAMKFLVSGGITGDIQNS